MFDISGEFAADEETGIIREHSDMDKTEAPGCIWTAKEDAVKAVHPHASTINDLVVKQVEGTVECVAIELSHPIPAGTESVA